MTAPTSTGRVVALEAALDRAAARFGDITPAVLVSFQTRFPEAAGLFGAYGGRPANEVAGDMVAQVIDCLMTFAADPAAVEVLFLSTVPHHRATVKVGDGYFTGLIDCTIETLLQAQAPGDRNGSAVLRELGQGLRGLALRS